MKLSLFCFILVLPYYKSFAANILAVLPVFIKSHNIFTQTIARELAEKGHNVTVITPFEEPDPPPNFHLILTDKKSCWDVVPTEEEREIYLTTSAPFIEQQLDRWHSLLWFTEAAFNSTSMKDFIANDNTKYDLIITELFLQEAFLMFAHKYNAPVVMLSSFGAGHYINEQMGNPLILSSAPFEFSDFIGPLTIMERMRNVIYTTIDLIGRKLYYLPAQQSLAELHFGNLPKPLPKLAELEKNVSLMLVNTHFSIDVIRPNVPGVIEIGGVHIKPPKELPKDLKKFMDDAKDGVIFFSLGTIVKSSELLPRKVDMIAKVFSEMKQKVLWKWENDTPPKVGSNVFISSWVPQSAVLAHPNTKLFITHGGLLGTQEAIYYGVPIIGMPFYGDQFLNIAKAVKKGYGVKLLYKDLTEKSLKDALHKILNDPTYGENAKTASRIFRDKPFTPMETAVYWIEYVIRNNGAVHMRSPILDLNLLEYLMIDVALLLIVGTVTVGITVYFFIMIVCKLLLYRKPSKRKHTLINNDSEKKHK